MARRPIASDWNGTYNEHPELWGKVDFIISAVNWDGYDEMKEEMDFDIPVFFNPDKQELDDIITHKANIINRTNVETFYEDQPIQANALKLLCPNCKIKLVHEGQTII